MIDISDLLQSDCPFRVFCNLVQADMARQELHHAEMLHTIYQEAFDDMRWVSDADTEMWEKCVNHLAETKALVEMMLSK